MAGDINLGRKFEKLPDVLEYYENEYANFESDLKMKGKTIERISTDIPAYYAFYSERHNELKKILSYMEARVAQVRGKLYSGIKKSSQVALGEREINKYIDADDIYLEVHGYMLEVREVHDMYASAVESWRVAGFSMNNIVKARVADVSDITL